MRQSSEDLNEDKSKSVIIIDPQSNHKSITSSLLSTLSSVGEDNKKQKQNNIQQRKQIVSDNNNGSSRIRSVSVPSENIISRKRNESFTIDIDIDKVSSDTIIDNNKKDKLIDNSNSDTDYYANIIHTQTMYMTNLVNSVLTIDKMECGKLDIINKPFEIRPLLWEVANTFEQNLIVYIIIMYC